MLNFLLRRLAAGLVTLFVALFLMYILVNAAIDPLADLIESTAANKEQLIAQRTEQLDLDVNVVIRFFWWIGALFTGDMGEAWQSGQAVSDQLTRAIGSTIELVSAATVLSLLVGVTVGIVSALRQYSAFDYVIIFFSFLLFSLPSFWVAVLLKQWGAIGFNDFLRDPVIAWPVIIGASLLVGLLWALAIGGTARRRVQVFAIAAAANVALLAYVQLTGWWERPQIGPVLLALLGAGSAFAVAGVFAGLHNRRALYAGLTVVALGVALYFPMQVAFDQMTESHWLTALLALVTVAVGYGIGRLYGGPDWRLSARTGAAVALVMGTLIFVDQVMSVWGPYFDALGGRPIPTFGDRTPNLGGNYWVQVLDSFTHLILPTATLVLIAFASYTRYARSSMLEVMNQDYVRTARAKGLPERLVIVRHGFRNALIPLATIVPIDVITLIGGAVITENVFGRPGMGQLFVRSLDHAEIEPVMAYLLVVASLAIIANIVADLVYAAIDPRIRLDA
ncbi:ABC transporter permease [Cellulomonas shaoxiangyii]|uniref:ABC transporter permease n=1 Tax=Cellulomonas shaoxiangyii TaxID=2566013 RepID=A0A4P7SKS2_9CELL|nr:ABC transporter permease [Cellulomonas shaoxiangyii]QCB94358.1 ABC transporter permease [Cellulomonas shaoxiangyii]TGY85197.1 ABC transporter permease [Cellulomonas shaoxiangyii]